jgi:hypothetical protein
LLLLEAVQGKRRGIEMAFQAGCGWEKNGDQMEYMVRRKRTYCLRRKASVVLRICRLPASGVR